MDELRDYITNLLVQKQLLTLQQIEEVLYFQKNEDKRFSSLLIEKKFIKKETLIDIINSNLELSTIDSQKLSQLKIDSEIANLIPGEVAHQYRILPLSKDDQTLTLGISDPLTILDLEDIRGIKGYKINPVILPEAELLELIEQHYPQTSLSENKIHKLEDILSSLVDISARPTEEIKLAELTQLSQEVPIIKATNFILHKSIESKASDVLIEPLEGCSRVRFRIDGIYHQVETLSRAFHPFIVSRIKVISNLDIAEHRLPQDGHFRIKLGDREVEFRVSVFPSTTGEKVALRLLDKSLGLLEIDKLGLSKEKLERLKQAALLPYGMILVCGPAGSGKTTTLYSILKFIHSPEKNIITVEDPVEYQIKGINQVSVNLKTGLIFSRCLRAILRQDPNVIMIGEIRDFETVDIAVKAALTGHLLLSTLHTTTAAGSVIRLVDMGVEPFLINASVICIIAQRLARRICPHCKEKIPSQPYFRGKGCESCLKTGYSGRVFISEILYTRPEIKEAIVAERLDEHRIKELARSQGMKTLREEGEVLAREGITTIEEVYRVTPAD